MLLHADPSLAEVPGFSKEQLDALACSVEQRRQQLEHDIHDYIKRRQSDLRAYEQEQLAHHRSMARSDHKPDSIEKNSASHDAAAPVSAPSPNSSASSTSEQQSTPNARTTTEPEEKAKRTKHSRVSKREKELYGLVTPVFLPLLDARDTSPEQEKSQPMDGPVGEATHVTAASGPEQTLPVRDADKSSKESKKMRREHKDVEGGAQGESAKENQHVEPTKKSRRSAIKKSALRQHNSSRSRRKRVSLVIDGQTVLPADTVVEPPLTSPSETTSTSNSTTSLDDMIDPRLTRHDPPTHTEHHEAVHHSLPLPMNSIHAPSKPLLETPTSLTITPPTHQPQSYNPPSTALHTFLHNPSSIPATAGPEPIFADDLSATDEADEAFSTYVGGLHGSGVDDLDQAGSYGYPSSLGASYLESYMQNRPLRVRMDAADKAGLSEGEKRAMLADGPGDEEDLGAMEIDGKGTWHSKDRDDGDDEMDIVGSMEGF